MSTINKQRNRAKHKQPKTVNVLFSCIGRRVQLLHAFCMAAEELGLKLVTHGADINMLAPAMHLVDYAHVVPRVDSGHYVEALLELCEANTIDLLIPLLDPELPLITEAVDRFREVGCLPLISSEEVIRVCQDKLATYNVLRRSGVDTPRTWAFDKTLALKRHRFPYYMKPRRGSAAIGNYVIRNANELKTFGQRVDEPIVQEFMQGVEYTLDVYCGFDGKPRCVVPRRRLEVRTGEVSKGIVVKDKAIMSLGKRVAEVLKECRGVVTVQCIATPSGQTRVIEINPRFGGGVPLAIHAGANFPRWILTEWLGKKLRIHPRGFKDQVLMLRYDGAVYVENAVGFIPSKR